MSLKKYILVHRPKRAKSQSFINNQFGTLLNRRGVSKVHVPKFDLIFSGFLPFIFEVFATKAFNFIVFTDRTKYYRDCSHEFHDKKRKIYPRNSVSWIYNKTFCILQNLPKVPKNPSKMSQLQVGGRESPVKPTCPNFGCPK